MKPIIMFTTSLILIFVSIMLSCALPASYNENIWSKLSDQQRLTTHKYKNARIYPNYKLNYYKKRDHPFSIGIWRTISDMIRGLTPNNLVDRQFGPLTIESLQPLAVVAVGLAIQPGSAINIFLVTLLSDIYTTLSTLINGPSTTTTTTTTTRPTTTRTTTTMAACSDCSCDSSFCQGF